MSHPTSPRRAFVEPLEARIAPAGVLTANWKTATFGAPTELFAGDGLSTGGANSGTYLIYVEKGSAMVFLTDLNNNGEVDYNEVTGIAAGDGLRLTAFVDIHGDITTNLIQLSATISGTPTTRLALTDSDNNRSNDFRNLGDGRILANSTIESITLRSLRATDLPDQNNDGMVDGDDVAVRKAYGTYSIFGDIVAGRGFGVTGGGLIIDTTNDSGLAENFGFTVPPSVGSIRVGTAASGHYFSYGSSNLDDINGVFAKFTPLPGQAGGDITGLRSVTNVRFNLDGLYAGDGGIGARGGNISGVTINADDAGGYEIIAGNGGRGSNGGAGGSILNFTDLGSQTGNVVVRSGSGGPGSTGTGGNAGNFSIGTFNVYGNITIDLGSGGDGFLAGGNGAALTRGLFNQATPTIYVPGNGVGTMNRPGQIGTTAGIDFDGDGFGDLIFTAKATNVLTVQFGNGTGGVRTVTLPDGSTRPDRLYLSGARNSEALTVNDFNGDGLLDIAAASGDAGSQAGIVVYLNKGREDRNGNGRLDAGEDIDGNGRLNFLGFTPGRYSNIAGLDTGDPDTGNAFFVHWLGPPQISSLTSGDYDGDGRTEIAAVISTYNLKGTDPNSGLTTSLGRVGQTVIFLAPDMEFNNSTGQNEFTGQFYMDFGTREQVVGGTVIPAAPKLPFVDIFGFGFGGDLLPSTLGNFNSVVIETSALTTGAAYDVVFVGVRSEADFRFVRVYDYSARTPTGIFSAPPRLAGTYDFGRIDTNRDLSPTTTDRVSLANYTLRDFSVLDFDADGRADLAVLSASPGLYLVGIKGDGFGSGVPNSGSGAGPLSDNAGNFFGDKGRDLDAGDLMAIKTVNADGDGRFDDLALLDSRGQWTYLEYRPGPQPTDALPTATTGVRFLRPGFGTAFVADAGEQFLAGVLVPNLGAPSAMTTFVSSFDTANPNRNIIYFTSVTTGIPTGATSISERGFRLEAGDGGDALIGRGGAGGLIGSGSRLSVALDPTTGLSVTDLVGSVQMNVTGTTRIFAGNGGNGFTTGGKGGTISGVVVRLPGIDPLDDNDITGGVGINGSLVAGDGGRGFSGAGGAGGDLTQNSIAGGASFLAGDGSTGLVGGAGGNVVGNGSSIYDSRVANLTVVAGIGADGVRGGGNGGSITGFAPVVGIPSLSVPFILTYRAGDGGDAVSGRGGRGGSVSNSSPREGDGIQGEIFIEAGDGGDGVTGGNGGIVTNFVSKPATASKKPAIVSILGGNGGDGLAGTGGNGGSVSAITVPTRGGVGFTSGYTFSRIVGGNGGESAATTGGHGGSVTDITSSGASEGSFALVGGAGGDGLWTGGNGGSVLRSDLFLPASAAAKALIVGGEGGNGSAFVFNSNDSAPNQALNAFGGRIGVGGNGGSIDGFTQRGNIGSHFDLIAGNGGDTVNFGSLRDSRAFVGKGGSISRVKLSGDIGNVEFDIPIKSYNNILAGETMADWVNANLRAATGSVSLTDGLGNVGIVVGTAGLNKAVVSNPTGQPNVYKPLPANGTVNGNLVNIEARNIMSAVAGNVDLIARIQIAQNIRVLGGEIGSDKGRFQQNDYLDVGGTLTADGRPVLDGRLVDGAVIARSVLDALGRNTTLPGRVYNL